MTAIFVLSIGAVHADERVRKLALAAVPKVCRTATHLFQFVKAARAMGRGWGRSMKTAVANWYNAKSLDEVAYLRFASVYRGFESLDDFEKAISELRTRHLPDVGSADDGVPHAHDG